MVSKRLWRGVKNYSSPPLSLSLQFTRSFSLSYCFDSLVTFVLLSSLWCIRQALNASLLGLYVILIVPTLICVHVSILFCSPHIRILRMAIEKCGLHCIVICSPFKSIWFVRSVSLVLNMVSVGYSSSVFFCTTTRLDLYAKIPLLFKTHLHQFMK